MNMNTKDRSTEIAIIIRQQLGHKVFAMMGVGLDMWISDNGLTFKIKGSKKANAIKITLNELDTYDVTFYKKGRAPSFKVKEWTVDDVYVDTLHECIERETGLYLSIGNVVRK